VARRDCGIYNAGPNELPIANGRASLDFILRPIRRRGERSAGNVTLQLASGRQQLPRTQDRVLSVHQISLQQATGAGSQWRGQILQGDQDIEPW